MIKIILLLYLSVAFHELGHFLAAKAIKIKVISAAVFMYPIFFVFIKGTLLKIGFIPVTGYVNAPGIFQQTRIKKIFYFAAGIIMNALLIACFNDPILTTINLYIIIFNLVPYGKSDGRNILESL